MITKGVDVVYATGDADCLIVNTAVKLAQHSEVVVVGEDTDLLALLCHLFSHELKNITLRSDSLKSIKKEPKVWDIRSTTLALTEDICYCLPFIYAVTGCDTTSRIYGIGKGVVLKLFNKNSSFRELCKAFIASSSKDEIIRHGEAIICCLHDPLATDNLNPLRFRKFASKVASSIGTVQIHTLPPTSDAASFHSLRVYHQTKIWIGEDPILIDPLSFGWEIKNEMFFPTRTTLPPAPEKLLLAIWCSCKTNCDSKRCTCRKHGLECSFACRECRGSSCSNAPSLSDLDNIVCEQDT